MRASAAPNKRQQQGLTLVELLVTMSLLSIIMMVAFNTFMSSNRLVEADTGRVTATQNTQGALDVMTSDVRQAGENLVLGLGVTGLEFSDAGQTLTVRRSIPALTEVQTPSEPALVGQTVKSMPMCAKSGNTVQIVGPPPSTTTASAVCTYTARPDGEDANVKPWRVYFAAEEERPQAAVLSRPANPAAGVTALVQSVVVTSIQPTVVTTSAGTTVRRVSVTLRDPVPAAFTTANNSTLTLLEEREYVLTNNELRLALGGQTAAEARTVAFNVTGFDISAVLTATTSGTTSLPESTVTALNLTDFASWRRLKRVDIRLTAGTAGHGRAGGRTFDSSIFPRNVESAR